MKLEILQENLSVALSQALKFISPKAQLPILGNFLIEAKNGVLKITATDMESSVVLSLGAKVEDEGEVTVSAKIFSDFIFSISPEKVQIKTEDEILTVVSGKNKAKFSTMPPSEFPKSERGEGEKETMKLSPSLLQKISDKMPFAVSTDSSRPAMTGIYFDNKEEKLKIVATDGFRLSLFEEKGKEDDFSINVPAKIIEELGKMSGKDEEDIGVYLNSNKTQVVFKIKDAEVSSRLIEGQYPPYEKIIPSEFSVKVVLDRQEFLRAVKTAAIFSKDAANIVRLSFSENILKVSSQTANLGGLESEIDCQKEGENLEVNFNFRYLLDILSRLSGKEVSFETMGENKPCVFRGAESPDFLHLIMPVKKA